MDSVLHLFVGNTSTTMGGRLEGDIYKAFKKHLGYYDENSQFKTGGNPNWDGFITTVCYNEKWCKCAIKKDGMHFPTGLISNACEFFKENNIPYSITDQRTIWTPGEFELSLSSTKNNKPFDLYDYQKDIVEKAVNQQRGIIKLGCGGGKTLVACGIIKELSVRPVIFYVTTIDLLRQAK